MTRNTRHNRPTPDAASSVDQAVDRINQTPMKSLKFKDFARLRSGLDELTRRPIDELRELVSRPDLDVIDRTFHEARDRNSAVRWRLRGLDLDRTIRKVKTDAEIDRNAGNRSGHRSAQPDHVSGQSKQTTKPT